MRPRSNFFLGALARKLILLHLLAVFLSGGLVFAQDFDHSVGSKTNSEYFVVIVTKGNPLNVRRNPSASSPVVASLPNDSKVPFVAATNNVASGKGVWFQVEYSKGKLGWVSSGYSRKIRRFENTATSQAANLESNGLATDKDVKPVAATDAADLKNSLQSDDIVKKPVVEVEADSPPVEKKGFFERFFSRKTKKQNNKTSEEVNAESTKPWANIDGFRSAKFGMKMLGVKLAISQDFKIPDKDITTINHPTERTESLAVTVEQLLPNAGKSRVVYVFGYKSKRLIQVNILTGHPVDTDTTPQQIINSGNLLGNHFFRKRYQKDGLVAHARLNDGSILIFRGKDQKGRMVLLRLSDPQPNGKNSEDLKIALNLSYIEKPGQPDTYELEDGDF